MRNSTTLKQLNEVLEMIKELDENNYILSFKKESVRK
jgi:hypothetical protein